MNIKKTAAVILSVTMALGMVSCKEDKEESSKSESKSNNGNVNTESVSESSSISANEESIADSVEFSSGSQEESLGDDSNVDDEYLVQENFSSEWEYERNLIFGNQFEEGKMLPGGLVYDNYDNELMFFEVAGIHSNNQDIIFNLDDSSEWLSNSYDSFVEMFDKTNQYSLNEAEKPIVFENEEEVEINGVKFIRFDGYFTDEELGKVNLYGYISTYQNDNARRVFKEPDVLGFIVTLPDEKDGQELLEEFATHAVESLKFTNK